MTDNKMEEQTREQIMGFLPSAIKRACESYHGFMEADFETVKSKLFTDHQNAGKAAAAHIQLLLKLTQWAGLQDKMQENKDFTACMGVAIKEADSYDPEKDDLA